MDPNLVVSVVGVVLAGLSALLAVPVLWLTIRAERRATERSVVEWAARENPRGTIAVQNQGLDPARKVHITVWTKHELVEADAEELGHGDEKRIELPRRAARGPEPVPDFRIPRPRVPDAPPEVPEIFATARRQVHGEWEMVKGLQDHSDAMFEATRAEAERQQVNISITWQSRRGVWATTTIGLSD